MNPQAEVILREILKKDPKNLNTDEIAFLRARVSYLKDSQKEEYANILNPKHQTSTEETVISDAKRK